MNDLTRYIRIPSIFFVLLILVFLFACGQKQSESPPEFKLTSATGDVFELNEFAGEEIYIKIWASWCSICLAGLEELDELAAKENDFTILTVVHPSYQGEKSQDDFITWFQSLNIHHMTVLLDEKGAWTEKLDVLAYPTSFYINKEQEIVKTIPGHQTNEQIIETIEEIK